MSFICIAFLFSFRFNPFASLEVIQALQLTYFCSCYLQMKDTRSAYRNFIHSLGYFPFFRPEMPTNIPNFASKFGFEHASFI